MSETLVTVATFSTPTEANIARNRLEADRIHAFLADEATVGMFWHLGTAVGGIKLKVAEDDVERAIAILEANDPSPITDDDWKSGETDDMSDADVDDAEDDPPDSPTDEIIARAFRVAVLGSILLPLQLYSLWLLLRVVFGKAPMSAKNRRWAIITVMLDAPIIIVLCLVVLWAMFSDSIP